MTRQEQLNEAWCKYMGKCSTEIMQALAFALRWCDQHPNWISVEDELPERDEDVLILTPQNLVHIAAYKYRDLQTKAHVFASGIDGYNWNNVTHWQHLPQQPEKLSSLERTGKNWKEQKGGEQ